MDGAKPPAPRDHPDSHGGQEVALGELNEVVGLHLRLAQGEACRTFTEALGPLDVTQRQVGVLWMIGENPGSSQAAIASALEMDRASMMQIVDKLEGRGLIERRRSSVDRRCQELELTDAGEILLTCAKALIADHEARLRALIGEHELAAFVAALKRIHGS